MNKKYISSSFSLDKIASSNNINEIVFTGLIILCFVGDVMGEVSDHAVILYWLLMTPTFFLATVVIEKAQAIKTPDPVKNNYRFNLILWGSAFFSVLIILFLWHAELFATQAVGLIIHVILGHTLFVSGIAYGLRFYLNGLFLLLLAWLTIAMEGAVGITLMLAIPLMFLSLHYKDKVTFAFHKKRLAIKSASVTARSIEMKK